MSPQTVNWTTRTRVWNRLDRSKRLIPGTETDLMFRDQVVHGLRGDRGRILLEEQAAKYNAECFMPTIFTTKCRAEVRGAESRKWASTQTECLPSLNLTPSSTHER